MTQPTDTHDLDHLREALPTWATDCSLRLVPALPSARTSHPVVQIDGEDMSARQFLDLAAAAAAPPLLYAVTSQFDPDDHLPPEDLEDETGDDSDPEELPPDLAAHLARAQDHRGRCHSIELAFLVGAVVHTWSHTADWHDDWLCELDLLQPDPPDQDTRDAYDDDTIQRLAEQLAQQPAFRAASRTRRTRIAIQTLTDPDSRTPVTPETARYAADRASRQVDEDAEELFEDLEAHRLPQLAEELARDPSYAKATKADVRRHRAQQFLAAHTGYRPPTLTVALLLDTPPLQRSPRTAPAGDALFE